MAALLWTAPLAARQGEIAGQVLTRDGLEPVAGAVIMVDGHQLHTVSDVLGRFRLRGVPGPETTLRVQRIGYRTLTEPARVGDLDVRLVLTMSPIELDAVVVTGTAGEVRRRAIGNVVTGIDASRVTEHAPIQDVASLINARAPGVSVQFGSGMTGAGPRIRIRGAASFSLNDQPLIYVDGVRVDNRVATGPPIQGFGGAVISRLNDIHPADIATLEIIKGPAAATLYGTEASNGVVHIITKRGMPSDRPRIGVTVQQGGQWFADAENRVQPNYWRDPATGEVVEVNLVRRERERGTPIWTTGRLQGFGADVSGGSDAVQFFAAVNYDADDGVEPTNKLRRLTGRANLSLALSPTLDANVSLGLASATTHLARENGGTWFNTLFGDPQAIDQPKRGFFRAPPEAVWQAFEDFQVMRRTTGGIQLRHRPTAWLSQRLTLGIDLVGENDQLITPRMDTYLQQFYTGAVALGSKFTDRRDITYHTLDYSGTVTREILDGVESSTSVGFQYYRNETRLASASGQEFPAPGLTTLDAAAVTFGSDSYRSNATVGVYIQQQFGWQGRRFLTLAVRADDNSAFGENFDFVTYPKVGASWVISEEPFWGVRAVESLRLRAAYGASGQQPETLSALRTFQPVTSGRGTAAVSPGASGNPDLAPERGEEIEGGFEASLFGGRLALDLTYYDARTRDALLLRSLPPSGGFSGTQWANIGRIRNRGVEGAIQLSAIEGPRANLDLVGNFSTNRNRVLDLGELEGSVPFRVGDPLGGEYFRRIVSARLDESGIARDLMCDGGPENGHQPVPCGQAPELLVGRSQPTFEGSLGSTLTLFERLRLFVLLDGMFGHDKLDLTRAWRCAGHNVCLENLFPEDHDPVSIAGMQWGFFGTFVSPASFVRLREVSVSYTLPSRWAGSFGATRASVSVGGRNLALWTSYTGLDPQAYNLSSLHDRADQDQMPQLTQIVTTFRVSF